MALAASAPLDYGQPPTDETIRRIGTAAILSRMIDPDSAKISWPYAPVASTMKGLVTSRTTGWAVCGRVNAKNRMGGYSGETWALIMFFNGEPIRVEIGDPLGDPSPASLSCDPWLKSGTLKPLQPSLASIVASNEARGMASATAIAAQGGYGISYVATPYGVYVMAVAPGSLANAAGLKAGAVVSSINGQAARTMTNDQVKAIIAGRTATGFDLKLIDGSTVHLPPL